MKQAIRTLMLLSALNILLIGPVFSFSSEAGSLGISNAKPVSTATTTLLSDGTDGIFSPVSSTTLVSDEDNIFNFSDINIAEDISVYFDNTLSDNSLRLLSSQAINIDGTLDSGNSSLVLSAPSITINGSLTGAEISIFSTGKIIFAYDSAIYSTASRADLLLISGQELYISSDIELVSGGSLLLLNPEGQLLTLAHPVPLPAAFWFLVSGFLSILFVKNKNGQPVIN